MQISPSRLTFKGVDLGGTLGNVSVKIETSQSPIKADQLGTTELDHFVSGHKATIETEIAQTLDKSNWNVVFPCHKLITSGGNQSFYFDSSIGTSLKSLGGPLIIHPLSHANNDLSADVMIYIATAMPKSDVVFSPTEQQKLKVVFNAYLDFTTNPPRYLFYGDPSVGAVNASAAAAVAGGGNVGGDTVGTISAFPTSKTETITITCVHPGTTGVGLFSVTGSVSGAQGIATVGTQFTSNYISFLITDGTPDATAGDTYTIAVTGPNYL